MAIARQTFIRNLHQVGVLTVAALGIAVAGILWVLLRAVSGFSTSQVIILATVAIVILGTLVMLFLVSWLTRMILRPVSNAAAVAARIASGDLTAPEFIAPGGASQVDTLTSAVSAMVTELRTLVGAIRGNAQDAAAMAQEISSATEEMSASTEEVSGTCNDLTDRATRQATLVRAAADDAAKILAIAEELAASALGSAERNAALAELARSHREQLDESSAELQRLAEEVERGAEEATALAAASEEIGKFVTQTKAIARQTHMLALNAGIEAARAGEEGRGFAVVAEEVRKLAGQAAQAATSTSDTVRAVQTRVEVARDRLLRLAKGGKAAREAAETAARGLSRVASDAEQNDTWTRQISKSADEVRGLIGGIVGRMSEVSGGTEDVAAAAEEIAASSQELSASTTEIANSAQQLAHAAQALFGEVSRFKVEER